MKSPIDIKIQRKASEIKAAVTAGCAAVERATYKYAYSAFKPPSPYKYKLKKVKEGSYGGGWSEIEQSLAREWIARFGLCMCECLCWIILSGPPPEDVLVIN